MPFDVLVSYTITLINFFSSKYQRKGLSTQHSLLVMIEKTKNFPDNPTFCESILNDLLIAKLNTYGFDRIALKLIYDYLSHRFQKNNIKVFV